MGFLLAEVQECETLDFIGSYGAVSIEIRARQRLPEACGAARVGAADRAFAQAGKRQVG